MLFKFVETQYKYPVIDDWTLQVVEDFKDFGIPVSFKSMRSKSEMSVKRMLKIKTNEFALNHLLNLKSEHSKMETCII